MNLAGGWNYLYSGARAFDVIIVLSSRSAELVKVVMGGEVSWRHLVVMVRRKVKEGERRS